MEIKLRKWEDEDLEALVLYANNRKIADYLTDAFPHPYTSEDGERFIKTARQSNPESLLFCIDKNGEAIGSIGAFLKTDIYRKNAEIGYWLAEPHWGQGIMSTAILMFSDYVFTLYPHIHRIFAQPFATNTGSCRCLEKAGFTREAVLKDYVFKNETFIDSCIYSLTRKTKMNFAFTQSSGERPGNYH